MTTSWFPDPSSNQISVFSWLMMGLGFSLLLVFSTHAHRGDSRSEAVPQRLFESLPPQVLDFSFGGGSY